MIQRDCLIVDDDVIAAVYLGELLARRGIGSRHVATLAAADAALARQAPALLIVDRRLPDGDGLRWLAGRLASDAVTARCLVCSGDTLEPAALPAGVAALRKPLDADALAAWTEGSAWVAPEASAADDEAALLDDTVATSKFGGNHEALRSLRRMFAAELAAVPEAPELPTAVLAQTLHRWRAACALTGCARLERACARAEQALASGDTTRALSTLLREIAATRAAIGV